MKMLIGTVGIEIPGSIFLYLLEDWQILLAKPLITHNLGLAGSLIDVEMYSWLEKNIMQSMQVCEGFWSLWEFKLFLFVN